MEGNERMSITDAAKQTGHSRAVYKKYAKQWMDEGKPGVKKFANVYNVSMVFVNFMVKNIPIRGKYEIYHN